MMTGIPSFVKTLMAALDRGGYESFVVGGAVLTQEYADQIGADAYAKDAMATVRYCDSVFEGLIR